MRSLISVQITLLRILSLGSLLASERLTRNLSDEQNRSSTCAYAGSVRPPLECDPEASLSGKDHGTGTDQLQARAASSDALKRSKSTYQRRRISFSVHDFHQLVQRIETMAKASAEIKPEDFYPEVKKHRGKSRDLPMKEASIPPILSRNTLPTCRGIGQALKEPAPTVGEGL